jgi:hypothetical protein
VSPLGELRAVKAAECVPVSEFESPKLNIAGNSQILEAKMGFKMLVRVTNNIRK